MVDDNILMPSLETNRAHIYLLFCTYYSRETQRGFGGLCVLKCMFQFFKERKEIAEFFGISECSLLLLCKIILFYATTIPQNILYHVAS